MNIMSDATAEFKDETCSGDLAVLLVSCDMYKDLWPLSTSMIRRFWPECPFPKYLLCNQPAGIQGFSDIAVGPDRGWSANLIKALENVKEEYVLLFLEDLMLVRPVSNPRVVQLFDWFKSVEGNCLRMNPLPPPDQPYNELVGLSGKGALYRASTVMTLWRKSVLSALLLPEENAWQFEIHGSDRSDHFDGFYAAYESTFSMVNTVTRGKWGHRAVKRIRRLGVEPDLAARGVMSCWSEWKWHLLEIRFAMLAKFPSRWRRSIRRALTC